MPRTRIKKPRPVPDPHHIYIHAVRFLFADNHIRQTSVGNKNVTDWNMLPAIVLSAFAAELFLKCLLILDGQTPPDAHHLKTLFKRLHNKKKARIEELWNKSVAARSDEFENTERKLSIKIPRDLQSALADCGNAFEGMRYVYEDPTKVNSTLSILLRLLDRSS